MPLCTTCKLFKIPYGNRHESKREIVILVSLVVCDAVLYSLAAHARSGRAWTYNPIRVEHGRIIQIYA